MKVDIPTIAIIGVLAVVAVLVPAILVIDSMHKDDGTAWDEFADQMNRDVDYYLEKKTGGSCGYVKTIGSEYSTNLNVSHSVSYGTTTINYVKVYAKEGGLALEWHKRTIDSADRVGDVITSTTYIPYESICYVQANKVV